MLHAKLRRMFYRTHRFGSRLSQRVSNLDFLPVSGVCNHIDIKFECLGGFLWSP